MSSAT
jgi:hypothetical protein